MGTRLRRISVGFALFGVAFAMAPRAFAATAITPTSGSGVAGTASTITIRATGFASAPKITVTTCTGTTACTGSPPLPPGVTFTDNGDYSAANPVETGTLTITTAADAGTFTITFTATATTETANQAFALTITNPSPTCSASKTASGAATTQFARGARVFIKGILPGATVSGTPPTTTGEQYLVTLNGTVVGSDTAGTDRFRSYATAVTLPSNAESGFLTVKTVSTGITARCPIDIVAATTTATPSPTLRPVATPLTPGTPLSALAARTATPVLSTGATLPRTGFPVWAYIAFGVTLIEIGGGLLLFADSRRRVPVIIPQVRRAASAIKIRWG